LLGRPSAKGLSDLARNNNTLRIPSGDRKPIDYQSSAVVIDCNRKPSIQSMMSPFIDPMSQDKNKNKASMTAPLLEKKDERNVRSSSNTYPLASKMLLQGLVILDNKPDGLPPSPIKPLDPSTREFFPSSPPRVSPGSIDPSLEVKFLTDEELKFVPKPPDQSLTTRRNSLPRRNSTRRRHGSGQNDAEKEKRSSDVNVDGATGGAASARSDDVDTKRSRPQEMEDAKDVRRSASLDARVPSVKSSKPPILIKGDGSSESIRKTSGGEGDSRRLGPDVCVQYSRGGDGRYGSDVQRRSMGTRRGNDTVRTTSTSAVFHKR